MDETCVHCGEPVAMYGRVLMHLVRHERGEIAGGGYGGQVGNVFVEACADGSGHVACLPQGGVE